MKKLFALGLLTLSASSFAAGFSFTYFGNEGNRDSFYSCDYVQSQTETYLELLGATAVDVTCSGGITPWTIMPVSIRAKFELPVVTGSGVEEIEIEGDNWNPACGVNVRIMREILKVMKNVEVVKKSDACAFHNSNYYYKLKVSR